MSMFGTHDSRLVNDMISVCHDGKAFYKDAAKEVNSPQLIALFTEMADIRASIEKDLQSTVSSMGEEPSESGTLIGKMRKTYTDVMSNLSDETDYRYVAQLEEAEDDALETFKESVEKLEDPLLTSRLSSHVDAIQLTHNRMRDLKHTMKDTRH
ncbi:ferritin-like domain-containing protein [Neptunomonas phycophila]|uniref:ferritin-like domain-containing protein n=1 Tax=Neptunomonas phycophila TaxID=1572645 RepID=UPI0035162423